ncbi:MAG: flagellar assembly protein FliH [Desulfobacteraceae bacterium Eth-SRB1]|nr:MAG: flagellar assembly protein FliH [Desulfobacteraceae bacterium Eth-SRB1]
MYLSDFNKVVKAQDIKLTDPPATARHKRGGSREKALARFVRGICHIPANEAGFNVRGNNLDIGSEIEEPGEQIEERIKIAAKEAYDRGFSKGLTQGIERGGKKLSLAVESVAKLIRELKILKEELLKSSEKKIIDLVFLIAGKVIHKEVSTGREVVMSVLSDAMRNMQERDGISIRLNPEDHRYITEAKPDFLDSFGDILIENDEKIGQGGAVIKTDSVTLDARLDQQLDKIRESLIGS